MSVKPVYDIFLDFFYEGIGRALFLFQHFVQFFDSLAECFVLLVVFCESGIFDFSLKLLLGGEMVVGVVCKVVKCLYGNCFIVTLLTALQQLVHSFDQFFVLGIDHLISGHQIISKFCVHSSYLLPFVRHFFSL